MSKSRQSRLAVVAAASFLVAGQLLSIGGPAAHADGDKDQKVAERAEIDQQLEDLKLELDDVNEDLAQTYLDLAETELLIPKAQEDLEKARKEQKDAEKEDEETGERLQAAEDEEAELSAEVESGQEEVDRSSDELAQVALQSYKGGGTPNPASVYVGSTSPQDAVDRSMNYKLTLSSQGTRLDGLRTDQSQRLNSEDRLTAVREEITELKKEAERTLERKEQATRDAKQAKEDLDDLYDRQKDQKKDLETKKKKYEDDQAGLEDKGSELDKEIEKLAREEARREQSRASSGATGEDAAIPTGGAWVRPVPGRVNSNFGWRFHPVYHTQRFHAGVDFPVACGVPVGSTHAGRVIQNTYNSAAGMKVVVSHGIQNGRLVTSSYHHLQGYAKPVGARVAAGETVGYVGTTGSSTGCHLHFEIHQDGTAVNPLNYV